MGCPPHSSPVWQTPPTPFLTTSPASLEGPWRVSTPPRLEPVTLAVEPPDSCKEGVSPPRPPALRPRQACLVAEPSASNKNCTRECGFFLGVALLPPRAPPRVIPSPAMALAGGLQRQLGRGFVSEALLGCSSGSTFWGDPPWLPGGPCW